MSRSFWHDKIAELRNKHNLGYLINPGGAQFTSYDPPINIQIAAEDDESIYWRLLQRLQELGREPPALSDKPSVTTKHTPAYSTTCRWEYRGPMCGYTGESLGPPDLCGKTVAACKLRFLDGHLPFGGFPSLVKGKP